MSTFNVHEWNRKRRLGENEETLKEAPIFDEIDMMVKDLTARMSAEDMLRNLMGELEATPGGPRALHTALKRIINM